MSVVSGLPDVRLAAQKKSCEVVSYASSNTLENSTQRERPRQQEPPARGPTVDDIRRRGKIGAIVHKHDEPLARIHQLAQRRPLVPRRRRLRRHVRQRVQPCAREIRRKRRGRERLGIGDEEGDDVFWVRCHPGGEGGEVRCKGAGRLEGA